MKRCLRILPHPCLVWIFLLVIAGQGLCEGFEFILKDERTGCETALRGVLLAGQHALPAEPILEAAGVHFSVDIVAAQLTVLEGRQGAILISKSELVLWRGGVLRCVPSPEIVSGGFVVPAPLVLRIVSELGSLPCRYDKGVFSIGEGSEQAEVSPEQTLPQTVTPALPSEAGESCRVRTIVIDPGHGGSDPGSVSPSGLKESAIVLDTALRLRTLIENDRVLGVERVVLTRDRDVFVPLLERAKIANAAKGDVFISLHVNASMSKLASGIETYFVSQTDDTSSLEVESRENAVMDLDVEPGTASGQPGVSVEAILMDLQYMEYVRESQALAALIEQELPRVTASRQRGVRQAMFYVLRGVSMPSVLVELGFLSCSAEEKDLSLPAYRQKLAAGLHQSVGFYARQLDERLMATQPVAEPETDSGGGVP